MRDRLDELGDTSVALVTFTRPRNLRGYQARLGLPFPVLADESRTAYRAYGFGRGPWWRVYGIGPLRRYVELVRSGARPQRPTEDTLQLGGDVVVAPDGRIAYLFRSDAPDHRPSVDDLTAAVRNSR